MKIIKYCSTRGNADLVTSAEAIIKGLAPDGGLYIPNEAIIPFKTTRLPSGDYRNIATIIFRIFLSDYSFAEIENAVLAAYNIDNFDHPLITPLCKLSGDLFVAELWHGPTYAFKDIALQILPYLLRTAVQKKGEKSEIIILTATSGDTGKSALEGFRDVPGTRIIVYFPGNGVSEVQKLQMTTQEGSNVSVTAVKGNFDDTQYGVKKIFNDHKLAIRLANAGYRLSSANSINWGRLLPQIVYYFATYNELVSRGEIKPGDKVNYVVPTGNFGNILAGYYARQLGLPVRKLICAANRNNVLSDFMNSGHYNSRRPLYTTSSPSMDILISSNLERLLYELNGHDPERLSAWMNDLSERGEYRVDEKTLSGIQDLFWSDYADEIETGHAIADIYRNYNYLIDTHTAVGKTVFDKYLSIESEKCPTVLLSTASPFKFAGSVTMALLGCHQYQDKTEIELLDILARETNTTIPVNLAGLNRKPVKHEQAIEPDKMCDHLLSSISLS